MKATFVKGVVIGAVVSSVTLVCSVALAGSGIGGVFNLGKANTVNAASILAGSNNGRLFNVSNTSKGAKAAGIGIQVTKDRPPLVINSSKKVNGLNADLWDGHDSTEFQRAIGGTCQFERTAIESVTPDGTPSCTKYFVRPIQFFANQFGAISQNVPGSQLNVKLVCHSSGQMQIEIRNNSSGSGSLNWSYSQGGATSTVNASGVALGANTTQPFPLTGTRLEGQWIWSSATEVTTLNLHVFDGGTFCEETGTAQVVRF